MSAITSCQICGSAKWRDLPDPAAERSVTTAGRILNESLGKALCNNCGFVQRVRARFLGDTDYYEKDYAQYYDRPGTTKFHAERYRVLAEWMASMLPLCSPSQILDVGCGQGWGMAAMQGLYPRARIDGLEPSHYNSKIARDKGFLVYESRVGDIGTLEKTYDLVYTNNVIQHVTSAREFLASLKKMASEDGAIIVTCPDGSLPNIELLWADQNYSFLPAHLLRLSEEIGFEKVVWSAFTPSPSVPPAQMLILSNNPKIRVKRGELQMPVSNPQEIYRSKCEYLNRFAQLDAYICSRTERFARVFNFGASYWSSILAAYCPRYWQRVSGCLVDSFDTSEARFLDKSVSLANTIEPKQDDVLVLGTSPASHIALRAGLSPFWENLISWNEFLLY